MDVEPSLMKSLIVERHLWETGAGQQQLQIPVGAFRRFFRTSKDVYVEIYAAPRLKTPSRTGPAAVKSYASSGSGGRASYTCRVNRVYELANIGGVFVCFNETARTNDDAPIYEVWWERDVALVAASFEGWEKAADSQYGRGRLWLVTDGPLERPLAW